MDPDYYSKYYHFERKHWWFTIRSKIISETIAKWVSPKMQTAILNTGVATGGSSEWLQQFGTVISVENDPAACRFIKEELKLDVTEASITRLPFTDNSFDMVCAFDVLEHVKEESAAYEEMKRVLKKEGALVVTVPAFRFLWSRHDVVNHHIRRYTRSSLKEKLQEKGFVIVYASYFNSLLFIPIALYRMLYSKFFGNRKLRSDFEIPLAKNRTLNKFFSMVFSAERHLLKRISFPAGISIILVARKQ